MLFEVLVICLVPLSIASIFDGPAVYQVTEPVDHGEGPTWDDRTNLLYFVNIYEGKILSYDYTTKELNAAQLHGNTTPIIPSKTDPYLFVVGIERSIYALEWDGKNPIQNKQILTTVSQQFPNSRFNDGKADKNGRLWFGTMGFESPTGVASNEGALYLITKDNLNNPSAVIQPVNISNGLAWNKANDKFYYIDTPTFTVREYDYDNGSGTISNPKVVFDLAKHKNIGGYPDGMTIDKDDNLWIALYYGGAVIKVDPRTGCLLQVVAIPALCVSSVAWGGPELDVLFVTTSRHALSDLERSQQPAAGSLFAITNLDYPVIGYEVNKEWWTSRYSMQQFIKVKFLVMPPSSDHLPKDNALLFCYFNNGPAFQDYINVYKGNSVIIIGPGIGRGTHTNPDPFKPNLDKSWKLFKHQYIGETKDVIAVYTKC
ncbi:hypothetical protein FQA39_LY07021 [Lamprigera yunnana]|nr:hypothetical protein FQA39_LY07021 [Lamprigera yunnana]